MMDVDKDYIELSELVIASLEGTISPEQFRRLNELIAGDPEAADKYMQLVADHAVLLHRGGKSLPSVIGESSLQVPCSDSDLWQALAEEEKSAAPVVIEAPVRKKDYQLQGNFLPHSSDGHRVSRLFLYTSIISTAALLMMMLYVVKFARKPAPFVARLIDTINAEWVDPAIQMEPNSDLRAEAIELLKGFAHIRLDDGAEIILEAPVALELESTKSIFLKRGKLTANVPHHAIGFTINTPAGSIVDLGTEFGVLVHEDGKSDLHMLKGSASLIAGRSGDTKSSQTVLAGSARRVDAHSGNVEDIEFDELGFVAKSEYDIKYKANQGSSYHSWLAYSYQLRRDRSLVAYYTFDKKTDRPNELCNSAPLTADRLNGSFSTDVSGGTFPRWTQGRWPQKDALEFDRLQGQYITVPDNGELDLTDNITIACWVWIGDESEGGHIISRRYKNSFGLQFSYFGKNFTYRSELEDRQDNTLQFIWGQQGDMINSNHIQRPLGQWQLIAVTSNRSMVTYYLNGRVVSRLRVFYSWEPVDEDLLIGKSLTSDYDMTGFTYDPLGFDGLIDEIAIFNRVLSQQEIMEMYEKGIPADF